MSVTFPLYDLNEEYAPGLKTFLENFKNKYGNDPKLPQTLVAYGGTKILSDTIEEVGAVDVDKIKKNYCKWISRLEVLTLQVMGFKSIQKHLIT